MWSLAIVEPYVGPELGAPLLRGRVGSHVGPLPEQGLNEAFGLAASNEGQLSVLGRTEIRVPLVCGWRIGKNSRVVRCARRPEPESSATTAFVRCTIEAVPSVSQGGRAIGVERWRVLSNQIFSRFRRQAAIGV